MNFRAMTRGLLAAVLLVTFNVGVSTAADLRNVTPEKVGISSERLQRFDAVIEKYIEEEKLAGVSMAISRGGKIAFEKHYGMADRERGKPIADDTIYRIHSMTKPIASTGLMMLYEESKFRLTDPIGMYIPELAGLKVLAGVNEDGSLKLVAAKRAPTIQDLMSHSAGFAYGRGTDPISKIYQDKRIRDREKGSLHEMIEKLEGVPLLYQPGERWVYSISVDIQAYLVEVLSGQTFDEFLQTRIFEPLGMEDTGYFVPEDKAHRFAAAYTHKDGALTLADDPKTSRFLTKPTFFSGSGGLVSTTDDYFKFAQMILNGGEYKGARLLSPKTVELMGLNHLEEGVFLNLYGPSKIGFGLGFAVRLSLTRPPGTGSIGEISWGGAANTYFWIDPEEDLIAIMMTQYYPNYAYPIQSEVHTLVYQALVE